MAPYLAAVVAAVLMWAAFPPVGWGPLAFVAPAPFIWGLRRLEGAWAALGMGFLYGAVFFGLLLNYVRFVGFVAWLPLTIWLAATAAGYALVVWAFRHWPANRAFLLIVGGWGLWELMRTRIPFGGFPWGTAGYATGGTTGLIGSVQWIGPSGWSILTVAVATGLVLVVENQDNWRLLVDSAVAVLLIALAGSLFAPDADGATLRVAVVQGNSPCPQTHCQNEKQRIFESHLELTRTLVRGSVDLVVWPENSTGTPFEPENNLDVRSAISAEAARLGAYFLVSGTRSVSPEEFLNINMMFDPNGRKIGEYAKRHPVPFGEYVPLRDLLDFIPQLDQVPRDMKRGDEAVVFDLPQGVVGTVISFEGAFPRRMRSEVGAGAQVLVVATNESTWGTSEASDQFIGLTRVNAAAMGQDVVHAAITGRSVFISADGSLGPETGLLTAEILEGEVQMRTDGRTIYARFGDWLLFLALAAAAAAVVIPGEGKPEFGRPA
jgi:apolipoprotein N-acyltransferase